MSSWREFEISLSQKVKQGLGSSTLIETQSCKSVLPHAANAIEWIIEKNFLNCPQVITKYSRQFQIVRDLFSLYCPVCNNTSPEAKDCWGKTEIELRSQILLRWDDGIQDEICPKCHNTKKQFIEDEIIEPMNTLIGVAGMRSSKSVLCGLIASYLEHEIAVVGNIHDLFDVLPGDPLQVSFIATTARQSEETIYTKFRALRQRSPWIQKYIAWVKEKEKNQNTPIGVQKWKYSEEADGEIYNGLIDVSFKALNSNSAGLAGATRIAVFLDELSRFDLSESKTGADEVVKVMEQGLATVRGAQKRKNLRPFWGMFCGVSSPISIEDKTMVMVKQKIPGQYSFIYPTWEMNPDLPRSFFDVNFMRDPVGAARDFGAQPPNVESPFIDDEARFRQAIDFNAHPLVRFIRTEPEDRTGRKYTGAKITECKYDPYHVHYLHFDAGASFDTFGGCSAHGEWVDIKDPLTGVQSRKFVTIIDWILGIQPVVGKTLAEKRSVWFDCVVEILAQLKKSTKIGLVTFDRWNSEMLIQNIRNLGIPTENKSVKTEDFMGFLRAAYEGDVRLLPPRSDEPIDPRQKNDEEKAIYELLRLERSVDLKRVYNPKKGHVHGMNSDDLAQVVVGAHMNVQGSVVAISDSTSTKEVLRRENAGGLSYVGDSGGRVARGRRW